MYGRRRTNRQSNLGYIILVILLIASLGFGLYWWVQAGGDLPFEVPSFIAAQTAEGDIASATSDVSGTATIDSEAGSIGFQVLSGLNGERLPGIRVSIAVSGAQRMVYAEDPSGLHVPVSAPLTGESNVRRLIMPPRGSLNYNITTASGTVELRRLKKIGTLTEPQLRDYLKSGGENAALIYLYNPQSPLALTGASLDAYATPYENVTVLMPGVDPDSMTAMVLVGLNEDAFDTWAHLMVDRYLAGRVGQPAASDLSSDLAFAWAYPVFDVFPPEESLDLGTGTSVTFRITWRSQNPDPPPPWSFFISLSEEGRASMTPENFPLGPTTPSQDVTITINREGLSIGEHTITVFVQPFSDSFGMIDQRIEREINFTVAEIPPTPTAGPALESMEYSPLAPREGDLLSIVANGFAPLEPVVVEFISSDHNITDTQAAAQADGSFTYQIDLTNAPAGTYTLRLTGATSSVTASDQVSVGIAVADAIVTSEELNLRIQPNKEASVIAILLKGDELTIISVNGDDTWYEVLTKTGEQGWVDARLIQLNIDPLSVPWNSLYPAPSP